MDVATKVDYLTGPEIIGALPDPTPVIKEEIVNGTPYLSVNGFIALPVVAVSSEFNSSVDIQVFDPLGVDIGLLTFTKSINTFDIARLTYAQLVSYLTEVDLSLTTVGSDYRFINDYLVIELRYLSQYLIKYFSTAPLWGRFCHVAPPYPPYRHSSPQIKAFDVDFSKSTVADATINQAINQYSPAERFLKLYHVLEADFDFIIVDKLRSVTLANAPHTLGVLLNSFGKSEYEKLLFILNERIIDIHTLVGSIDLVLAYQAKAEVIFYNFSKSTNPLSNIAHFKQLCLNGGFVQRNFTGLSTSLNIHSSAIDVYRAFILKLAAYWIYRVRCCIAHKKIGEYMLQSSDEDFLVEFAEPLVREVLRQYLS